MTRCLFLLAVLLMPMLASAEEMKLDDMPAHAKAVHGHYCDQWDFVKERSNPIQSYALKDGRKLVMISCYLAAYNAGSIGFLVDNSNRWEPIMVPTHANGYWMSDAFLSNPDYDEKTQTIFTYHKHRGLGDCWTSAQYGIHDYGVYLKKLEVKDECDGKLEGGTLIYEYKGTT